MMSLILNSLKPNIIAITVPIKNMIERKTILLIKYNPKEKLIAPNTIEKKIPALPFMSLNNIFVF